MDVRYVNAFLDAVIEVLGCFGINDVRKVSLQKKENMHVDMDITAVIGLVGSIRGNIAYSLSEATALGIVSKMMMSQVASLDEMSRSALGELSNMITGKASTGLSSIGEGKGVIDLTAPSVIIGKDIYFIISSVPSIAVVLETQCGSIEVNIGLEI